METKTQIQSTNENVDITMNSILNFVKDNNYQIKGDIKTMTLVFDSKKKKKVLSKYLTSLSTKVTLKQSNRFLHFLFKKIYKLSESPKIILSEKELNIQVARLAWKKSQLETDILLKKYKEEKGDYYKTKV